MSTVTVPRAVLEQVLEALQSCSGVPHWTSLQPTITALRAALAQQEQEQEQEQEPVAWRYKGMIGMPWSLSDDGYYVSCKRDKGYMVEPLYTHPPRRETEREPVAWVDEASIAWLAEHPRGIITTRLVKQKSPERQMAMYAEPPRREWQSLSDEERDAVIRWAVDQEDTHFSRTVARAIEAALKEKNNG